MEEFQLLSLQEDEDEDPDVTIRPAASKSQRSGRWKVSRSANDLRRPSVATSDTSGGREGEDGAGGSLESLHFSFDKNRPTYPVQKRCGGCGPISILQGGALSLVICALGFVLGYFAHRVVIPSAAYARDISVNQSDWTTVWKEKLRYTPDFARCPKEFGFERPALLVQSFDGLAARFVDQTPFLAFLRQQGLHAPQMRPVFPTSTFPNHYSIVTGLYPESHGIIDNHFFSPTLNSSFTHYTKDRFDARFWKGVPIWQMAQEQGRKVFAYYWPGSDVPINGVWPTNYSVFRMDGSVESRAHAVVSYLQLPKHQRPDLVLAYFHEPDNTAHRQWMNSGEFTGSLAKADHLAELIMENLYAAGLLDCVNVVFLSDHGIEPCKATLDPLRNSLPQLSQDNSTFVYEGQGPINRVSIPPGATAENILASVACAVPDSPYQAYLKEDLPVRMHYYNNDAISPVLLLGNISNVMHRPSVHLTCRKLHNLHGWDNLYDDMGALFMAYGPSFKMGTTVKPFANIELFNLFSDLLDIRPVDNNGTFDSLRHLLRANFSEKEERGDEGRCARPEVFAFQKPRNVEAAFRPACGSFCPNKVEITGSLDAGDGDRDDFRQLHVGNFGVPLLDKSVKCRIQLLVNRDYVTGFCPSKTRDLALWSAFQLPFGSTKAQLDKRKNDSCVHEDPRVVHPDHPVEWCHMLGSQNSVVAVPLFPSGFSSLGAFHQESLLSSNMLPMYSAFYDGIWTKLWDMIAEWNHPDHRIRAFVGPVFDYEYPLGTADLIGTPRPRPRKQLRQTETGASDPVKSQLASHFFVILTRKSLNASYESLSCFVDVLAFVIPHRLPAKYPCQSERFYLLTHTATVADVERITGLRFFGDFSVTEAAQLRTRLADALWES